MGNAGLNLPEWVVMSDSVSMQAVYRKVAFASDTAPRGMLRHLRYNTATRNTPHDEEPKDSANRALIQFAYALTVFALT